MIPAHRPPPTDQPKNFDTPFWRARFSLTVKVLGLIPIDWIFVEKGTRAFLKRENVFTVGDLVRYARVRLWQEK